MNSRKSRTHRCAFTVAVHGDTYYTESVGEYMRISENLTDRRGCGIENDTVGVGDGNRTARLSSAGLSPAFPGWGKPEAKSMGGVEGYSNFGRKGSPAYSLSIFTDVCFHLSDVERLDATSSELRLATFQKHCFKGVTCSWCLWKAATILPMHAQSCSSFTTKFAVWKMLYHVLSLCY